MWLRLGCEVFIDLVLFAFPALQGIVVIDVELM